MFDWLQGYEVVLGWLFAVSMFMFVGSLIAVPWLVMRIPTDYFVRRRHFVDRWQPRHPPSAHRTTDDEELCGIVLVWRAWRCWFYRAREF